MKILVIGANGRLGRACVGVLPEKGHEVIAFVRSKETFPAALQSQCVAVVQGDATNQAQLESALRDYGCAGVVEAGGYTPFLGTNCNLPAIYQATLDAAEAVAAERSGGRAIRAADRLRVWVINDIAMMDSPYGDDATLKR